MAIRYIVKRAYLARGWSRPKLKLEVIAETFDHSEAVRIVGLMRQYAGEGEDIYYKEEEE